ncbi:MAG: hypothetical protein WCX73_04650 [Candidatus Pacearchaeota archaeon]|jgi:glutamate 5-kinase
MKLITKLGTNVIFDSAKQEIKTPILEQLAKDAQMFLNEKNKENQLIVVTSGAVGLGSKILTGNNGVKLRQAQASVGQPRLMQEYISVFDKYSLNVAQLLLTYKDLDSASGIENIKNTYENLKNNNIIPIVNENDVTAIEELKFGDNDSLATQLAMMLDFDMIINYTQRGTLIRQNNLVSLTNNFDYKNYDKLESSGTGFGGLKSKLESAKKTVEAGKQYIIAKAGDSILEILSVKVKATRFYL